MKRSGIKRGKKLNKRSTNPRSVQIRVTDLIWGTIVCIRDKICKYCGKNWANHPHHIFARDKCRTTRYSTAIGIGLCGGCHKFRAHNDPENWRHINIAELDKRGGYEFWKRTAEMKGATPDPFMMELVLWKDLEEMGIAKPDAWREWSEYKKEKHLREERKNAREHGS